jgi:CDP-diacylglycerol--serine O-phosphatidyltransferase
MSDEIKIPPRRRGVYLLPNLFTTAALFAGFYAIIAGIGGRYEAAAVAIFIAMVLDGVDGRVARLTNTQTEFGAEYDSLSDMVSFGLAPALVMFQWSLSAWGKLGWMAAFIYASATALRLARFNTQAAVADKRYFLGLASPSAAAVVGGLIWLGTDYGLADGKGMGMVAITFIVTVAMAVLMVSNIRYQSFKNLDFKGRVPFVNIIIVVLAFALISLNPALMLFGGFLVYALSGPTAVLVRRRRMQKLGTGEVESDKRD